MPRTLPPRPNLDQLKRQARELLRALLARDSAALQRFGAVLPLVDKPILAQALHVIAREYGFASWPVLRQHIAQIRTKPPTARQQNVALLAERLAGAAQRRDLEALFAALQIGARAGDEVRALLVERGQLPLMLDLLLRGAESSDARVRFLAAQAMDHWADQRCAAPLRRLLHDPVPRVRWAALHSLQCAACKLSPLATAEDLTETLITLALGDPSVKVRRVATYELGQLCAAPRAAAALAALAADADAVVARNARRSLARPGTSAA